MEFKSFFFFESMLTPKIITFLYWLMLVVVVVGGLVSMFTASFFGGLVGIVLGVLFTRIGCELMIVAFKMNDALQAIRKSSEPGAVRPQELAASDAA